MGNYNTITFSEAEWLFVVDPLNGLDTLGLEEWPGTEREREVPRVAHPFAYFRRKFDEISKKLRVVGEKGMSFPEFAVLRLYTGPLYVKYNGVCESAPRSPCNDHSVFCKHFAASINTTERHRVPQVVLRAASTS